MKLNFWQWLGLILLVLGVILVIKKKANNVPVDDGPATTQR